MTRIRAIIWMTFIALFIIVISSLPTQAATSLDEAEAALSRAQNEYFEALLKGGPKSQKEQDELYKKILAPATQELNKVLEESNKNFSNKFVHVLSEEDFKKALQKADREQETLKHDDEPQVPPPYLKGIVDLISSSSPNSQHYPKINENQKPLSKQEPVIDGKDIPAELVYPGKKKPLKTNGKQ